LNIVVLTKLVPDTTADKRLSADGTLDRASIPVVLNPWDEFAIEEALRIKEAAGGGEVVLLVMAPEQGAQEAIRKALAMGADRAVLISDPALHGTDMWGTGHVLAGALKKLQYDLILSGSQSSDAGGGMIYGMIAAELGLPLVSWINEITVANGMVRGKRGSDVGYDVIEAPLPAIASVTQTAHEPRYPTLPNIMKAKKKEIAAWTLADVGVGTDQVGLGAARTAVTGSERPQTQRQTEVVKPASGDEAAKLIADFLERRKLI
jgi:electron transfer flavoprotein beta subunit